MTLTYTYQCLDVENSISLKTLLLTHVGDFPRFAVVGKSRSLTGKTASVVVDITNKAEVLGLL